MAISLQADSTLPQGYILVDGQRVASVSTTGGLSATLAANTVTTSSLVSGAVTTEKIAPGAVVTADLADGAVTASKMAGGQTGDAPVYGCRAWVNFNGTLSANGVNSSVNGQPVFINNSGNVSQVIKTSAGNYVITFTTSVPTTSYAVVATNGGSANISYPVAGPTVVNSTTRTLSSFAIINNGFANTWAATNVDSNFVSLAVFC